MKQVSFGVMLMALVTTVCLITSCSKNSSNGTPVAPTLYDSLGGTVMVSDPKNAGTMIEQGRLTVRSVVDSTIFVIAADNSLNGFFKTLLTEVGSGNTSGFQALEKNLTDFVCVGAGAKDFTYGGKSMVAAHDPAQNPRMNGKASNANFTQFETDLTIGAGKNGVSSTASVFVSLSKIVESLRTQVVQQ